MAFGTKEDLPENGHPDNGSGKYSQKLGYKEWFELNCSIRTHLNYIESLPQIIVFLLVSGLYFPKETMNVSIVSLFARPLYVYMYKRGGPDQRYLTMFAGYMSVLILGLYTSFTVFKSYLNN